MLPAVLLIASVGCGPPKGVWFSTCDLARAHDITVAADNRSSSGAGCPAGSAAFTIEGFAAARSMCQLADGSLRMGAGEETGAVNASTCASITWTGNQSFGWCRLPRSAVSELPIYTETET